MIRSLALGESQLKPVETKSRRTASKILQKALWVDLHRPTAKEKELVASVLGIDFFTREELEELEESSRAYLEDGWMNLICWMLSYETATPSNVPVGFIAGEKHIVSLRDNELHPFRVYTEPRRRAPRPRYEQTEILLIDLLDTIVGHIASSLRLVEQDLNRLSSEIFAAGEFSSPTHFRSLKSMVHLLGRRSAMVANLRDSAVSVATLIPFLINQGGKWMTPDSIDKLRVLGKDIRALREYDTQLSGEISFLLDSTVGLISIDQNQSMKFLGGAAVLVALI